jgi:hypothetical protein
MSGKLVVSLVSRYAAFVAASNYKLLCRTVDL